MDNVHLVPILRLSLATPSRAAGTGGIAMTALTVLIAAVRRLALAELARWLRPLDKRVNERYARCWAACVKARNGDSRGLEGVSQRLAQARLRRLTLGMVQCQLAAPVPPANDTRNSTLPPASGSVEQ